MGGGLVLEVISEKQKSDFKAQFPKKYCYEGVFMKLKLRRYLLRRSISVAVFCIGIFSSYAVACELSTLVKEATIADIKSFFESQNKDVLTFVGYSGGEYEDKIAMLDKASRILDEFDPSKTIVNIGATPEGIGAVYELAKRRGLMTTGIISTQAKKYKSPNESNALLHRK
jgi:hypothetical protein